MTALLTICVPTYNRRNNAVHQVISLVSNLKRQIDDGVVRILVVDNQSSDGTVDALSSYCHACEIKQHYKHFDTVEESIIEALDYVDSQFVWFLGDDDYINFRSFDIFIAILLDNLYDFYVLNGPVVTIDGQMARLTQVGVDEVVKEFSARNFLFAFGIQGLLAGISNGVHRVACLKDSIVEAKQILSTVKIYSHSIWYLLTYKEKRICVLTLNLFSYRLNDYNDSRWERYAIRNNFYYYYPWMEGIAKALNILVESNLLSMHDIVLIKERADDGREYSLFSDLLYKLRAQLVLDAEGSSKARRFTNSDFEQIKRFICGAAPLSLPLLDFCETFIKLDETMRKNSVAWFGARMEKQIEILEKNIRFGFYVAWLHSGAIALKDDRLSVHCIEKDTSLESKGFEFFEVDRKFAYLGHVNESYVKDVNGDWIRRFISESGSQYRSSSLYAPDVVAIETLSVQANPNNQPPEVRRAQLIRIITFIRRSKFKLVSSFRKIQGLIK